MFCAFSQIMLTPVLSWKQQATHQEIFKKAWKEHLNFLFPPQNPKPIYFLDDSFFPHKTQSLFGQVVQHHTWKLKTKERYREAAMPAWKQSKRWYLAPPGHCPARRHVQSVVLTAHARWHHVGHLARLHLNHGEIVCCDGAEIDV
jgi:hypothetical protein